MSVKKGERRRTIADLTNKRYYFEFADMPNADKFQPTEPPAFIEAGAKVN